MCKTISYLLIISSLFFFSSCDEESDDPRVGRPEVTIIYPLDSSAVIDSVIIEAAATDDKQVAKVEFYINGLTDSAKTILTPPYRYKWDVSAFADSSFHTISAKVYDYDRKYGTSKTVTVRILKFTPTNLRVTAMDNFSLTIKWNDNSSIETGFEVQMSENGFSFSPIDTVESNITSLTVRQSYVPFKPYYFRVRAITDSLVSKFSNVLIATLELLPPGNLLVTQLSDSTVRLQWIDKNNYETGYQVEMSQNGTNFSLLRTLSANVTTTTISTPFERTENYFFRVRTFTNTDTSGYSNQVRIFFRSSLYAGGDFTVIGSSEFSKIAEWDDVNWLPLSSGMNGAVYSMAEFQGKLFVGGMFTSAGDVAVNRIASWDGMKWSAVGNGLNGVVKSLANFSNELYAGGSFTSAGGVSVSNIARWNGSSWSTVGNGMNGTVNILKVHQGDLYAGGSFSLSGSDTVLNIARWDGTQWSSVGNGVNGQVFALSTSFSSLIVGGDFTQSGTTNVNRIALWNNSLYEWLSSGFNNTVYSLERDADGLIFAGGSFTKSGDSLMSKIAFWTNNSWNTFGNGLSGDVLSMKAIGRNLFITENYSLNKSMSTNRILRLNNGNFTVIGDGLNGSARVLTNFSSWHWERMY
ncbi:MAG: hypothetical protein HY960_09220 [Ignavibacteriae bacterium]|nr:hypothetical protein [Ignavibacteriota bacterium]